MNLFVPYPSEQENVEVLDDVRVRKMLLETAQIFFVAAPKFIAGIEKRSYAYAPTHTSHPVVDWAGADLRNLSYIYRYWWSLYNEYKYRFGGKHESGKLFYSVHHDYNKLFVKDKPITFANCTSRADKGISFKDEPNVHLAYKKYLNARWHTDIRPPRWSSRLMPEFYELV